MFNWRKQSEKKKEVLRQRDINLFEEKRAYNAKKRKYEAENRKYEAEREAILKMANIQIQTYLRAGYSSDYFEFLDAYVEAGGSPTHHYEYDLRQEIYIAEKACKIFPLYGAQSIMVIMKPGCTIINGDTGTTCGHNSFYIFD